MDISKYLAGTKLNPLAKEPLYLQLANLIEVKIKNHEIQPGTKLPPERELASLLDVSRTTTINAYRHLEHRGFVKTRVGSGTYVSDPLAEMGSERPGIPWPQLFIPYNQSPFSSILRELVANPLGLESISLGTGMPDPKLYPLKIFQSLMESELNALNLADLGYIPTEGYTPLRQTLAVYLRNKGINVTAENVMILSGAQQGLYLITKTILVPGDYVVVESPTYIGAIQQFQNAGARLLTLPCSEHFPLALLEDYLIRYRPKLLYLIPTFKNPSGRVIPEHQRRELLQLAARHRLVILEDDPYSELYYQDAPPPSLKALDNYDGVAYLGTFSKILFPGLRTGFIAANPSLINRLALEKQYVDLHSNNLTQWLVQLFLEQGNLSDHLAMVRKEYKKRRDTLVRVTQRLCGDNLTFLPPQGGFYLWCRLTKNTSSTKLLHEATKNGISFVPGQAFYPTLEGDQELRLCFATHDETVLIEGVKRLAKSFSQIHKKGKYTGSAISSSVHPII
ncbi:MocR-like pyridoxine biosynthesis transcription factor PdxR [Desulforamulus aquiferis]|uniref:PLP-dependent aminotransferase family protein n=1 Tax=Desulforamulus aquiferis TaxID=1397668 RepID=A0AAW7Z6W8_9FIRM|nr:PLP-dependent aminotransferase family protein [Desulforamulus aquiferis]MDO7785660.1 PLP-dependent aminotransferase family protein [Desulforamulus aquiferis]RYD03255.1 hypothetical protein N752_20705 [Desulforamulus aquiferis]